MSDQNDAATWQTYIRSQIDTLASFAGAVLTHARYDGWALYETGGQPIFEQEDLPFLQAMRAELRFKDERKLQVGNRLSVYSEFGLHFQAGEPWAPYSAIPEMGSWMSGVRPISEFPLGKVEKIEPRIEGHSIQEVRLTIGNHIAVLKAGEVDEDRDDRLIVREFDECVLIFLDEADYQRTIFSQPAYKKSH